MIAERNCGILSSEGKQDAASIDLGSDGSVDGGLRDHARNGIRQIDRAIATDPVLEDIRRASQAAKTESNRLQAATRQVHELTALVDKASKVVKSIGKVVVAV